MNITSDKLCGLALLVIFVLAVVQIYYYISAKPTVIEEKFTEHMNPNLLTHQIENLASKPGDPPVIQYYIKENRFAKDADLCPRLEDTLISDPGLNCGPKMNWQTLALPGANNVYGDMIWNKTSPKMVLESNCMNCNQSRDYNGPVGVPSNIIGDGPSGIASDYTSSLNAIGTPGALSDQYLISSPENLEKFINLDRDRNGNGNENGNKTCQ